MSEKDIKRDSTEEIKNNQSSGIGYSGKVTVKVISDKKVISKSTGHNNGGQPLFNFLAYALTGNYSAAEPIRPLKIKLFNNKADSLDNAKSNIQRWATGSIEEASDFIYANSVAVVETQDTGAEKKATAVMHFRVPFSFIANSLVNQLCIYGKNTIQNSEYSAYYLLTENVAEKEELASINVNPQSSYSLIIEWELNIANRTVS